MQGEIVAAGRRDLEGVVGSLWSKPLGQHNAEIDDDEEVELTEEFLELPEQEVQSRHSNFRKTVSWETPPEQSRSGRVYQTVRLSQMESSRPTMNIRSSHLYWSSSPRPLALPPAPSLTSWTHTVNNLPFPALSGNSPSRKGGSGSSRPKSLMGKLGGLLTRTNSGSYIKETGRGK